VIAVVAVLGLACAAGFLYYRGHTAQEQNSKAVPLLANNDYSQQPVNAADDYNQL
jgi:hypothetical protein